MYNNVIIPGTELDVDTATDGAAASAAPAPRKAEKERREGKERRGGRMKEVEEGKRGRKRGGEPKWCTAELGRLPDRHGAWTVNEVG